MAVHTATVGPVGNWTISQVEALPDVLAPPPDPAVEAEQRQAAATMSALDKRLAEPLTRDDAIKLRDQLFADEGWVKRYMANSPDRAKQIEKLVSVINQNPNQQTEEARWIEDVRANYDLPPEAVDHLRENKAVSAAEKYAAQQKKRELRGDPEFVRAYFSGSLREQRMMQMLDIITASPLIEGQ
jgi:hypothetical protein